MRNFQENKLCKDMIGNVTWYNQARFFINKEKVKLNFLSITQFIWSI